MNQDQEPNVKELNAEQTGPVTDLLHQEPVTPLFLKDSSEGKKGDAQDEKDKTEE